MVDHAVAVDIAPAYITGLDGQGLDGVLGSGIEVSPGLRSVEVLARDLVDEVLGDLCLGAVEAISLEGVDVARALTFLIAAYPLLLITVTGVDLVGTLTVAL